MADRHSTAWRSELEPISEEALRELYCDKRMTQAQIARHLECSPARVQHAMRRLGVKTRRSSRVAQKDVRPSLAKETP